MASALSASLFSLPLPSWQQTPSPRAAHYERRKRKKAADWTDTEGDGGETTDAVSVTDAESDRELVLTPNESHQYRIAGLPLHQELPNDNYFPHGPAKEIVNEKKQTPQLLWNELSSGPDPVYIPQSAEYKGKNLHIQHLAALTTLLHRCLLEGDFTRAGRAWGLLLREEFRWVPLDMRNAGRWGIGAEILLRRGVEQTPLFDKANEDGDAPLPFTQKGAEEAKEYYESLILNYPYLRVAPRAISALHFYPAMFGLWIYVTQEESNKGRKTIDANYESSEEDSDRDDSDSERPKSNRKEGLLAGVRAKELQQAQQIAVRMDSLLGSPPYSDSTELLQMRGMVSLWIADLLVSSSVLAPISEGEHDSDDMSTDSPDGLNAASSAPKQVMDQRQVELDKSREFLERANERGKGVTHNLENLHFGGDSSWGDLDESL